MVVVYADDELSARQKVSRALRSRGYTVFTLDTGGVKQLEAQVARLLQMIRAGLQVDVLVLDGHNFLLDENGRFLVDMTPVGLLNWLWQNGMPINCHLILYTNDNQMVTQALEQTAVKFAAAICKVGEGGGLKALIESVDNVKVSGRAPYSYPPVS